MLYRPKKCVFLQLWPAWSKSSSKKFFQSKSSSSKIPVIKVPHLFRSRSGVLRVVRYSLSSPFPEPSLHSFTLPFTLSFPSLVAATLLSAIFWLFRIVFASSLRRDLSQTLVRIRGEMSPIV